MQISLFIYLAFTASAQLLNIKNYVFDSKMEQLSIHDRAVLNCVFNPNLPLTEAYAEELDSNITDNENETPAILKAKQLELNAIKKTETGNLDESIIILNRAIEIAPLKPSLYNNRAQIHQLKNNPNEALQDLGRAIELCDENYSRTLCLASCQRGLLLRKSGKDDLAKEDFEKAAKLGSQFAKSQLIELNPYAALCNQMLRKVMEELK